MYLLYEDKGNPSKWSVIINEGKAYYVGIQEVSFDLFNTLDTLNYIEANADKTVDNNRADRHGVFGGKRTRRHRRKSGRKRT